TSTTYHTYDYADRFSTCYFLFRGYPDSRHRHSFPTRRSSDLRNPSDRKHVVCSIANLHRTSYVVLGWPALGFARVRDQMHMHTVLLGEVDQPSYKLALPPIIRPVILGTSQHHQVVHQEHLAVVSPCRIFEHIQQAVRRYTVVLVIVEEEIVSIPLSDDRNHFWIGLVVNVACLRILPTNNIVGAGCLQ